MGGNDEIVVLRNAEYDVYNCGELSSELASLSAHAPAIDLQNVRYVDSTCLTELVRTHKRVQREGAKRLRLINVSANIRQILSITGLDKLFELGDGE